MDDPLNREARTEQEDGVQDATALPHNGPYGLAPVRTAEEAAAFLRVNVKTVYNAISAGQMPGRKVGNRTIILRDAMLSWLKSPKRVLPSKRKRRS